MSHTVTREWVYKEQNEYRIVEDPVKEDGPILVPRNETRQQEVVHAKMFQCSCGDQFRKEHKVIEHLNDVGAYDSNIL